MACDDLICSSIRTWTFRDNVTFNWLGIITSPCSNFNGGLTHWGRMTHICVNKIAIIGSDNGLSPERHQAIIWTNAGILLIWPLGAKLQWNFNRNAYIFIRENACENIAWKMTAILSRLQWVNQPVIEVCEWMNPVFTGHRNPCM